MITTKEYLALKPGDKIIPNNVYWHEKEGQVVLVFHSATIDTKKWDRDSYVHGYFHPNDIPADVLHEGNTWLDKWLHAIPLNRKGISKNLLPAEIERVLLEGSERWFEIWDHHDNN